MGLLIFLAGFMHFQTHWNNVRNIQQTGEVSAVQYCCSSKDASPQVTKLIWFTPGWRIGDIPLCWCSREIPSLPPSPAATPDLNLQLLNCQSVGQLLEQSVPCCPHCRPRVHLWCLRSMRWCDGLGTGLAMTTFSVLLLFCESTHSFLPIKNATFSTFFPTSS